MNVHAIETHYAGCRFRSRIEARWAVFFDALRLRWEYEREGFQLSTGWYLPDFWLPEIGPGGAWIEIKGERPTKREEALCMELACATHRPVYLFSGAIPTPGELLIDDDAALLFDSNGTDGTDPSYMRWDLGHQWCECIACGRLGIHFEARAARLGCGHIPGDRGHAPATPRLVAALTAARSARFDCGHPIHPGGR